MRRHSTSAPTSPYKLVHVKSHLCIQTDGVMWTLSRSLRYLVHVLNNYCFRTENTLFGAKISKKISFNVENCPFLVSPKRSHPEQRSHYTPCNWLPLVTYTPCNWLSLVTYTPCNWLPLVTYFTVFGNLLDILGRISRIVNVLLAYMWLCWPWV